MKHFYLSNLEWLLKKKNGSIFIKILFLSIGMLTQGSNTSCFAVNKDECAPPTPHASGKWNLMDFEVGAENDLLRGRHPGVVCGMRLIKEPDKRALSVGPLTKG